MVSNTSCLRRCWGFIEIALPLCSYAAGVTSIAAVCLHGWDAMAKAQCGQEIAYKIGMSCSIPNSVRCDELRALLEATNQAAQAALTSGVFSAILGTCMVTVLLASSCLQSRCIKNLVPANISDHSSSYIAVSAESHQVNP